MSNPLEGRMVMVNKGLDEREWGMVIAALESALVTASNTARDLLGMDSGLSKGTTHLDGENIAYISGHLSVSIEAIRAALSFAKREHSIREGLGLYDHKGNPGL